MIFKIVVFIYMYYFAEKTPTHYTNVRYYKVIFLLIFACTIYIYPRVLYVLRRESLVVYSLFVVAPIVLIQY